MTEPVTDPVSPVFTGERESGKATSPPGRSLKDKRKRCPRPPYARLQSAQWPKVAAVRLDGSVKRKDTSPVCSHRHNATTHLPVQVAISPGLFIQVGAFFLG